MPINGGTKAFSGKKEKNFWRYEMGTKRVIAAGFVGIFVLYIPGQVSAEFRSKTTKNLKNLKLINLSEQVCTATSASLPTPVKLKEKGPVLVKISTELAVVDDNLDNECSAVLAVGRDGIKIAYGPSIITAARSDRYSIFTVNCWFRNVPAGTHTINIEFWPYDEGDTACVRNLTVEIYY